MQTNSDSLVFLLSMHDAGQIGFELGKAFIREGSLMVGGLGRVHQTQKLTRISHSRQVNKD